MQNTKTAHRKYEIASVHQGIQVNVPHCHKMLGYLTKCLFIAFSATGLRLQAGDLTGQDTGLTSAVATSGHMDVQTSKQCPQ